MKLDLTGMRFMLVSPFQPSLSFAALSIGGCRAPCSSARTVHCLDRRVSTSQFWCTRNTFPACRIGGEPSLFPFIEMSLRALRDEEFYFLQRASANDLVAFTIGVVTIPWFL